MKFKVFDVGHGFCAYAVAQNGNVMVFDCGHKVQPEYRPSKFLPVEGCISIEWLFITNFDEDHISDLPQLRSRLPINVLVRNRSISSEELRTLKLQLGPITPAMQSLLDMHSSYTQLVSDPPLLPGIEYKVFTNRYGFDFNDTNNLSLVVFLHIGGLSIIIPGDLESPGWNILLNDKDFRDQLSKVTIFIASHHGRESGYCPDVFTYCHPDVIVISDGPLEYGTQDTSDIYGRYARGIIMNGESRKVISTRRDGSITWNV